MTRMLWNAVSQLSAHSTIFILLKDRIFSIQNNPKNLNPSYKMDLNFWDCLGRVKLILYQKYIGLIQLFEVIVERGNPSLTAN